ncbi:hypothetical protein BDN70DRAFT_884536 [Pholiota conissans]|uniref:Uncharacterized protein n=1 Tax=Pholiota conissans TaxID=109636 RepID=A0A9P6CVD4_9AGAR|nr:hypothetical protein BDN70DRAFT_884536 [Pholiota conissans]
MVDFSALLDCRTSASHRKGLLGLSPELILEISSHILSPSELRATRRDSSYVHGRDIFVSPLLSQQHDLANLRLVCRYLGTVLQRETFKSLVFNFHVTRWDSADDVESQLALLAQGDTSSSLQARVLLINCADPIREGYGFERPRRNWFSKSYLEHDDKLQAKAKSIQRFISNNLVKAITSFQNLRCVRWEIQEIDALSVPIMNALSSLPSLEDLTLDLGFKCRQLSTLGIDKFHDLRSLVIVMDSFLSASENELMDHLSVVVRQSPRLSHLSVLENGYTSNRISLERLVKNVPRDAPLHYLNSLHIALPDIMLMNPTILYHLKALKVINIAGFIQTDDLDGSSLWERLTTAKIHLEELTVSYLSDPLLAYLASYSGLQKLRISLFYILDPEETQCDILPFVRDIIPLHSLSFVLPPVDASANVDDNLYNLDNEDNSEPIQEGLIFEAKRNRANAPSVWRFEVCSDAVPVGLSLLLACSTQSVDYHAEKLKIRLSRTMQRFRCGTGSRGYAQRQSKLAKEWISELQVPEEDVAQYPTSINLDYRRYDLKRSDDDESLYLYQPLKRSPSPPVFLGRDRRRRQ